MKYSMKYVSKKHGWHIQWIGEQCRNMFRPSLRTKICMSFLICLFSSSFFLAIKHHKMIWCDVCSFHFISSPQTHSITNKFIDFSLFLFPQLLLFNVFSCSTWLVGEFLNGQREIIWRWPYTHTHTHTRILLTHTVSWNLAAFHIRAKTGALNTFDL